MGYKESVFNLEIPLGQGYLLYNTCTGALALFDRPVHEAAQGPERALMIEQGFLVDERIHEVNRLIMERNRELYSTRIRYLHIEIAPTMQCQAKCWYCFENGCAEKKTMTEQVCRDTVSFIQKRVKLAACEELCLLFFGGEPLLAAEQIKRIAVETRAFCEERGIRFHSEVITNGIAFTPELADALIPAINLTKVQITLDGMRETHDAAKGIPCFDRVVENIRANARKTRISVRVNVSARNREEIGPLVDWLLRDQGLDGAVRVYLARVDDMDSCGIPEDDCVDQTSFVEFRNRFVRDAMKRYKSFSAADLLPDIRRNYCGYEKISQIMIGPEGELYRCQRTMGDPANAAGDIYAGSFYRDEELAYFRPLEERCLAGCSLLPVCFGGCPNERRKERPLRYCALKREQIEKDLVAWVEALRNG